MPLSYSLPGVVGTTAPSLNLDMVNSRFQVGMARKAFADVVTFTRASGGGRFNAAGQYEWLAADQPRIDYDPLTLACKGLLVEEQRTNLLTESEFRNGLVDAPTRTGLVSAVAFTGFAGGIAFGHTGSTSSSASKQFSVTDGATYTFSFFVEMDDTSGQPVVFGDAGTPDFYLTVNGVSVGGVTTRVGTKLFRVSHTRTIVGTNAIFGVGKISTYSARTFKVTGYQLEAGAFPTSYIPTTTAQVTRSADVASVNTLSPWYRQDEGTLFVDVNGHPGLGQYWAGGAASLFKSTDNPQYTNHVIIRSVVTAQAYVGANGQSAPLQSTNTSGKYKAALGMAAGSFALSVAGGAPTLSSVVVSMPVGVDRLAIGRTANSGGHNNGHIKSIRYYPRRLSNAELQALTA